MSVIPLFESVVTLGRFNPAILTPDILADHCDFKRDDKPGGRTTPVHTEVIFDDTRFLMELDRFEIVQRRIKAFGESGIFDIMLRYLELLKYTPIFAIGINFSASIKELDFSKLSERLSNHHSVEVLFETEAKSVTVVTERVGDSGITIRQASFTQTVLPNFKHSLQANFEDESLTINSNFELSGLDKDRSGLNTFKSQFGEMLKSNSDIIRRLLEA